MEDTECHFRKNQTITAEPSRGRSTPRSARSSQPSGSSSPPGKTRDVTFRRGLLKNLRFMIRDNEGLILEALRADLGKSFSEGYLTEIGMVEQEINHTLRYLKTWTSPKTTATPYFLWPASSRKLSHPRGLVMIFSPWNYPFLLTMQPLISSIAAGNCTILKLSEHSPHTTKLLCYLIDKYFDREYIAAYTDSFEAVKAIRYEPFGMVFYTGGPTVARIISKAAATQLTPVVMELGMKEPVHHRQDREPETRREAHCRRKADKLRTDLRRAGLSVYRLGRQGGVSRLRQGLSR